MGLVVLAKHATSTIFGIFFINVGIAHFTDTQWFEPIVPDVLGDPTIWVLITGIIEIVLGMGYSNAPNPEIFLCTDCVILVGHILG